MLSGDPDELYVRQLEKNLDDDSEEGSHLGFLTMINDYNAKLAWKFETVEGEQQATVRSVTTMVQVMV